MPTGRWKFVTRRIAQRLREFITKVKSFGYNHIRHWAHTPVPEFCEIADEEGVTLTIEMPYYHSIPNPRQGRHSDKLPNEYNRPLPHLRELLTHFRRHASVFTFCGGNEGGFPTEKKPAVLLQAVRAQAPGKLWTLNSGHIYNNPDRFRLQCGLLHPQGRAAAYS